MLSKWKCAQESQQSQIAALVRLRERLLGAAAGVPPAVHFLLPDGVVELVLRMHAVACAAPPRHERDAARHAARKANKQQACASVSEQTRASIAQAVDSARTKFDHLDAFFERDETKVIAALLVEDGAPEACLGVCRTPHSERSVISHWVHAARPHCQLFSQRGFWFRPASEIGVRLKKSENARARVSIEIGLCRCRDILPRRVDHRMG